MQAGISAVIISVVFSMAIEIIKGKRYIFILLMALVFIGSVIFDINIILMILLSAFVGLVDTFIQDIKKSKNILRRFLLQMNCTGRLHRNCSRSWKRENRIRRRSSAGFHRKKSSGRQRLYLIQSCPICSRIWSRSHRCRKEKKRFMILLSR